MVFSFILSIITLLLVSAKLFYVVWLLGLILGLNVVQNNIVFKFTHSLFQVTHLYIALDF